ncbi:MAG: DUF1311 domain-containing protein [Neisseriaceae bacterium]|nr:DUF1311 domain-containing protein [Neisseriaceae bacterium]MBP6861419.1 DUF1311 domain-containing protein [Neisseriaceae bacterium]
MKKTVLGLSLSALLGLAACGGETVEKAPVNPVSCTNPEATQFLLDSVAKKAEQSTLGLSSMEWSITEGMVQTVWQQLQAKIDNIRTEEQTDSKVSCVASYTVDVPAGVMKQAQEGYVFWMETDTSLLSQLDEFGWAKESSSLVKNIQYTVQQTDDGKKIITEQDKPSETIDGLAYLMAAHFAYDFYTKMFEAEDANEREYAEREAKLQVLDDERTMAKVKEAQEMNKFAHQRLNAAWNSLPEDVRNEMKGVQKAWNEKRDTECRYSATANAERSPEQSLIMVQCDNDMVASRTDVLEDIASRYSNNAQSTADKQLAGLKTQMQQTWSTFPREVKDALQKEQQDWLAETQTICTSKRSQTDDQEASKLLYAQCMVAEYQQRIAALKKFQV